MNTGQLIVKPICAKLTYDTEWFGKMDPYAKITVGGSVFKTTPAHDQGKNPNWQDTFTFRVNGDQVLQVQLYDQDDASADDFIAEGVVNLSEVYNRRQVSNWFPLQRKGTSAGQIMINLEFYPDNNQNMMGGGGMMNMGMNNMGMGGGYGGNMGMGGGYGGNMGMGGGYGGNMGMGGGYGGNMGMGQGMGMGMGQGMGGNMGMGQGMGMGGMGMGQGMGGMGMGQGMGGNMGMGQGMGMGYGQGNRGGYGGY
jgi:Ca2+-dependent lipid-binding protein